MNMEMLLSPLQEMGEFEEIKKNLQKPVRGISLSGCVDSQKIHMIYGTGDTFDNKLIVTYSDLRAREIYEDTQLYEKNAVVFPAKDLIFYQADIHGNQLTMERMKCYRKIVEGNPLTIITTFQALMTPQVTLDVLKKNTLHFRKGHTVDTAKIAAQLVMMGYEKNFQVEAPGQFSVRGGILDIFDLTEENPYRIELWGDEVEEIRSFDILSQRSIEMKREVFVYPATELILTEAETVEGLARIEAETTKVSEQFRNQFLTEEAYRVRSRFQELKEQLLELKSFVNLESYIKYFYGETKSFLELFGEKGTVIFMDEPSRIREHAAAIDLEFRESMIQRSQKGYLLPGQMDLLYSIEETLVRIQKYACMTISSIDMKNTLCKTEKHYDITAKSVASYSNSFENLSKDLKRYKKNGYRVLLLSASRSRAKRLAEDLREQEIPAFYSEDASRLIQGGEVMTYYGKIRRGFEYPLLKFLVISESDIFGVEKKKKKKRATHEGQKIQDYAELKVGDYVVHENHGLGIYQGIEKVQVDKVAKDYIKITYRDGGNLYILATGLEVIQKYASADAKKPKLNKLGTKEWGNTKTKVRTAVNEVAKDLVDLYAVRQEKKGFLYGADTAWQREFEEMFPFDETEDQMLAIDAAKQDMESYKIMDRLVCGDVGYGKTEVAIRIAFKAVQEGKQVVYLVPTTILAQQHYNTFMQRMKDFPVRIDLMSRFRSPTEQKKTIQDLKVGLVDIVIGTHRVLSKDMAFKDLGLLIIDEEQRFGVTHKEKIKKLKEDVDVLTLTATPIPRTLHMSLIGIRDMSVLEEAPNDRLPIQTYVLEYNEEMVREAIVRELARDGQVYYVYNRVHNIDEIADAVQKLVPEATVAYAHGQMKEHQLERMMYAFINHEIDVLVSTTIIETGLDISNANTMIIHDADNLGLSQLYQLRGRVGRSNRNAYAFLLYKRDKLLKEVAEKRLQAIREFTDLGSGFKIAMRDLEIRGAGNLLGEKQHGHMEAVGYELYCKMLNDAVKKLKGVETVEEFITTVDLDVDAFIPGTYIVNEIQKLDIYKRIAGIENQLECNDRKEELLDRFGSIPKSADNLLRIAMIRVNAHRLYVSELQGKSEKVKIVFHEKAKVNVEKIPFLLKQYQGKMQFSAKGIPTLSLHYVRCGLAEKDAEMLLRLVEQLLIDMEILLT